MLALFTPAALAALPLLPTPPSPHLRLAPSPPPTPPRRLDHKNATVGWVYKKDDIELEPRFNLGTESLAAGVTWKVDDENKLRAVFDMGSNEGTLTWTNTGALGGGGDTKLTARMKLDKDSMQQVGRRAPAAARARSCAARACTSPAPLFPAPPHPTHPPRNAQMPTLMIQKNWDFEM